MGMMRTIQTMAVMTTIMAGVSGRRADVENSKLEEQRGRQKIYSLGISFLSNYNDVDANACSIKLSSLM
jgi:hypothetical protein